MNPENPQIGLYLMNYSVRLLNDSYTNILSSPLAKAVKITFEVSKNGESAFVDIFGDVLSARITIYDGGIGDCEILGYDEEYNYSRFEDLNTPERIKEVLYVLLEKVARNTSI